MPADNPPPLLLLELGFWYYVWCPLALRTLFGMCAHVHVRLDVALVRTEHFFQSLLNHDSDADRLARYQREC